MAAFIGGGRDSSVTNNIFVDCRPAIHLDARALGWAHECSDNWVKEANAKGTISGIKYNQPPYSVKYPALVNILNEDPPAPRGNVVARNVCWGGKWDSIEGKARPLIKFEDNLLDQDPRFVNAALLNFQLRDDSPAWKLGFKRIPIEEIGLYKDERRASWPVRHIVRPMPKPPTKARAARTGAKVVFKVTQLSATKLDPTVVPEDWADGKTGEGPSAQQGRTMLIAQGIQGEKAGPRSLAWLAYDDENLYVAIRNEVDKKQPIRMGAVWGQDDAVEVALRDPAAGKNAPIYVLRGYPNGKFESSTESGIPEAAAKKAGEAVKFAAKVVDPGVWTAEYKIPLAALGIDPKKASKFEFNISARKTAGSAWIMWQGTFACTWEAGNAGIVELAK